MSISIFNHSPIVLAITTHLPVQDMIGFREVCTTVNGFAPHFILKRAQKYGYSGDLINAFRYLSFCFHAIPEKFQVYTDEKYNFDATLSHIQNLSEEARGPLEEQLTKLASKIILYELPQELSFLLAHGVKPNTKTKSGYFLLNIAASNEREGVVRVLLENKADPNVVDPDLSTPLHNATGGYCINPSDGPTEIVKTLLAYKANPNVVNHSLWTPLHNAAAKGFIEIVETLLAHKADPNVVDRDGLTPLHLAVKNRDAPMVRILLGSEINSLPPCISDWPPLLAAVNNGYHEIVRILLEYMPAHCRVTDHNGTLLLNAIYKRFEQTVRTLLEFGSNPNAIDRGYFPLLMAAKFGYDEILKILLENKADPNKVNDLNITALLWAVEHKQLKAVSILLDFGADPKIENCVGDFPLLVAAQEGFDELVKVLLEKGADPNGKNEMGNTPLIAAACNKNTNAMNILLKNGATPSIGALKHCNRREAIILLSHKVPSQEIIITLLALSILSLMGSLLITLMLQVKPWVSHTLSVGTSVLTIIEMAALIRFFFKQSPQLPSIEDSSMVVQ